MNINKGLSCRRRFNEYFPAVIQGGGREIVEVAPLSWADGTIQLYLQ